MPRLGPPRARELHEGGDALHEGLQVGLDAVRLEGDKVHEERDEDEKPRGFHCGWRRSDLAEDSLLPSDGADVVAAEDGADAPLVLLLVRVLGVFQAIDREYPSNVSFRELGLDGVGLLRVVRVPGVTVIRLDFLLERLLSRELLQRESVGRMVSATMQHHGPLLGASCSR